jgi:hypothetical protein
MAALGKAKDHSVRAYTALCAFCTSAGHEHSLHGLCHSLLLPNALCSLLLAAPDHSSLERAFKRDLAHAAILAYGPSAHDLLDAAQMDW